MPRKSKVSYGKSNSSNVTKEKLAGTPFNSAEDMKAAQHEILTETWNQLEKAKARHQLLQKPEYQFVQNLFKKGWSCGYREDQDGNNLVKVFISDEEGVQIEINEQFKSGENSAQLIGVLIRAMAESFQMNYLKATGIVPQEEVSAHEEKTPYPAIEKKLENG